MPWLHAHLPMAHLGIWHKGMHSTDRVNAFLAGKRSGTSMHTYLSMKHMGERGAQNAPRPLEVHWGYSACHVYECTRTNLPETVDFHRIDHKSALCSRKRSSSSRLGTNTRCCSEATHRNPTIDLTLSMRRQIGLHLLTCCYLMGTDGMPTDRETESHHYS